MTERIDYDEFGMFHENAAEYGLPYDGPPTVRRQFVEVGGGRRISALVWGEGAPELVLLHGGSQNAHTWDTVAMALGRPLVAVDLPGHGHSDGPADRVRGPLNVEANAADVAVAVRALAPDARGVVGMSLGGLTLIALARQAPELVRRVVLVDITPGINRESARHITDFVNGPPTFPSFEQLLERTIQFNPTRSVSSLRRGILHNAVQLEDGSWEWRWARWRRQGASGPETPTSAAEDIYAEMWGWVSAIQVPVMLARGMTAQSVIRDDDEAELLRRHPGAHVVRFVGAGHSIQGDKPVELAREIEAFVFD
ncbi:MAG TPA: alpha/beta hydrolase [Acidimicrobiales bacterium]|nr:alpha/beta hydrolase [Acidimicrobiales bacterium]